MPAYEDPFSGRWRASRRPLNGQADAQDAAIDARPDEQEPTGYVLPLARV